MKCEYCDKTHVGLLERAYALGWVYLQFQSCENHKFLTACPQHAKRAENQMCLFTLRSLGVGRTARALNTQN